MGDGLRRTNAPRRDDKIVVGRHAAHGFGNLTLIVGDYLDAFQVDAEREAEFSKVCLHGRVLEEGSPKSGACACAPVLDVRVSSYRVRIDGL